MFRHKNPYRLKAFMRMNDRCPVCGQPFDMEPGFYYGTSYVSYVLALMITAATLIAWWVIIGFSLDDKRFFWWMGLNALFLVLLQPAIMRLSRSIWLSFFVRYDPKWRDGPPQKPERINEDMKNAW